MATASYTGIPQISTSFINRTQRIHSHKKDLRWPSRVSQFEQVSACSSSLVIIIISPCSLPISNTERRFPYVPTNEMKQPPSKANMFWLLRELNCDSVRIVADDARSPMASATEGALVQLPALCPCPEPKGSKALLRSTRPRGSHSPPPSCSD